MKLLWITNIKFPYLADRENTPLISGGWMVALAEKISAEKNINLAIATISSGSSIEHYYHNNTDYYLIPCKKNSTIYDKRLKLYWQQINDEFSPDIIHIHGTEFAHGLAAIQAIGSSKVVISLQGLVSTFSRYYLLGITCKEILINLTLRDIIRMDTLFQQRKKFIKRGKIELRYFSSGASFIGRTTWDKSQLLAINPSAKYYHCDEILRKEFYFHKWELEKCQKNTIFISQAYYPIKGFHQLLKAMPIILRHFPNTKLYVAGNNFLHFSNYFSKLRISGYSKYINYLITKFKLQKNIQFTGILDEKQMANRLLNSNVFICPSSIENSPNSLAEAQVIGVPCIASNVGGIQDMVINKITGLLYRFEDYEVLAQNVIDVFSNDELANQLSVNAREYALKRHSVKTNVETIMKIYNSIAK